MRVDIDQHDLRIHGDVGCCTTGSCVMRECCGMQVIHVVSAGQEGAQRKCNGAAGRGVPHE